MAKQRNQVALFGGLALSWVMIVTMFELDTSPYAQVALLAGLGAALSALSQTRDQKELVEQVKDGNPG